MSAKILSAGDYIASRCSKCKDSTNHTIVAMVGEKVVKVECNTCGSIHNHRAEKEKKPAKSRATATGGKTRTSASASKTKREWDELLENAKPEEATPYSMQTPMKEGMLILHPTFGLGQIVGTTKPNKMDVRFQSGVKLLRCTLA